MTLVGPRKVSQLQESIKALDVSLSRSDLKKIDDAIPANAGVDSTVTIKFKNGMMVFN